MVVALLPATLARAGWIWAEISPMIGNPFLLTSNSTWLLLQLPEVLTVKWTEVAVWAVVGDQTGLDKLQATLVGEEGEDTGEAAGETEGTTLGDGLGWLQAGIEKVVVGECRPNRSLNNLTK